MRNFKITIICVVLLVVSVPKIYAQATEAEKAIQKLMDDLQVVGLSVAVVKDNKVIYTKAFGVKNLVTKEKLVTTDLFRIASVSKSFSATAVMQLLEAQKLNLDDDISKYLSFNVRNPHFPNNVITLRMLLSHTSSLNDSDGYKNMDMIDPVKSKGRMKCYSVYAPGTKYKYSNLNYSIIGSIIEKASGQRFDTYIQQHITKPLGLDASFNADSLDHHKFVSLYTYNKKANDFTESSEAYLANKKVWNNYKLGYSAYSFSPAGGMKISAPDLAKYMIMHINKGVYNGVCIMKETSAILMQTPVSKLSKQGGYGFALSTRQSVNFGRTTMVGHTGGALGLTSAMFFSPEHKFGFVVICSGSAISKGDEDNQYKSVNQSTMSILYRCFIK